MTTNLTRDALTPYTAQRRAGLAKLADDVNEQALAERYAGLERFDKGSCHILYEMLKAAGATEQHDALLGYLVRLMARKGFTEAGRRRRVARRRREGEG